MISLLAASSLQRLAVMELPTASIRLRLLILVAIIVLWLQCEARGAAPLQQDSRLQPYLYLVNRTHLEKLHSPEALHADWLSWKKRHGRVFAEGGRRELEKFAVWKSNKVYIDYHNAFHDVFGYRLSMNQFGDMTPEEYAYYIKCLESANYEDAQDAMVMYFDPSDYDNETVPDSMDWRQQGIVSGVKDQGRCQSCYAFAVTGALESMNALASRKLVTLSEQNIIDCTVPYGNRGCSGGSRLSSLLYVIDVGGLNTELSYPYSARQSLCRHTVSGSGSCTGLIKIHKGRESDLKIAVGMAGPVTVAIDSKHYSFQFYEDGIYNEPDCSSSSLTHTLLAVGYGTDRNGKDYWLLKNSWGTSWGDDGYIKMARNYNNQCGIATRALFPML